MLPNKTAASARMAVAYITGGALLVVWTVIWYIYLKNNDGKNNFYYYDSNYYFCVGLFLSGLTLMVIGLAVGKIGRQARHADVPPPEAVAGLGDQAQAAAVQTANGVGAAPGQPGAGAVQHVMVPVAVPPAQVPPQPPR